MKKPGHAFDSMLLKAGERVPYAEKNVTNDANLEMGGSEFIGGKQVVEAPNEFENLIGAISAYRERGMTGLERRLRRIRQAHRGGIRQAHPRVRR